MTQITIEIDDAHASSLLDLLGALSFVHAVRFSGPNEMDNSEAGDFFALAGLWEGRELSKESLRQQAWPRRSS